MAIVYSVWGKVAIVYGLSGLYLSQGPEKKGVSDEFFFYIFEPGFAFFGKKK